MIIKAEEKFMPELKKLFCDYYAELDCEDDPALLFDDCIATDFKAGLLDIYLACENGEAAGFVIFQTDDVINDWCYRDGAGDIREIFVSANLRGRGIGKELMLSAERAITGGGAEEILLFPTDESEGFFKACGYEDIGEYCAELDCKVFGKKICRK